MKDTLASLEASVLRAVNSPEGRSEQTALVVEVAKLAEALESTLLSEAKATQAMLDASRSAVVNCATVKAVALKSADAEEGNFKAKSAEHDACLTKEGALEAALQECEAQVQTLDAAATSACNAQQEAEQNAVSLRDACQKLDSRTVPFKESIQRMLQEAQSTVDSYLAKEAACTQAKAALDAARTTCAATKKDEAAQEATCTDFGDQMDAAACGAGTQQKAAFSGYTACYDPTEADYKVVVEAAKKQEADLKADFVILQRIKCLISAMRQGAGNNRPAIEACLDKSISTDSLDIVYQNAPPMEKASPPGDYPCTAAYLDRHYGPAPDRRQRCQPCTALQPPTPQPTPQPTPPPGPQPVGAPYWTGVCYYTTPTRPLRGQVMVTSVAECIERANGYKYFGLGCPQSSGFECWRGNSIASDDIPVLEMGECMGIGGRGCGGYKGKYTEEWNGTTWALGGWFREPVYQRV